MKKKKSELKESYKEAVAILYSGQNAIDTRYKTIINRKTIRGIADHAFTGLDKKIIAVEAKFIKDWSKSISNPEYKISHKDFSIKHREFILYQARKYNTYFHEAI